MQERILTPDQVAQVLQVHPFTILKFIKQGKLKASKLGRVYRIRESEVERFLDQATNNSSKEKSIEKTLLKEKSQKQNSDQSTEPEVQMLSVTPEKPVPARNLEASEQKSSSKKQKIKVKKTSDKFDQKAQPDELESQNFLEGTDPQNNNFETKIQPNLESIDLENRQGDIESGEEHYYILD